MPFSNPANEEIASVITNTGDTATHTATTASNVASVNSTLGTPAQDSTVSSVPSGISVTGVPSVLPVLLRTDGPFGANTAWQLNSGNPVPFTTGGGYELIIRGGTSVTAFVTDVQVIHQDVSGHNTYIEQFTASNWVGGTGSSGVIISGNLHGTQLVITGLSCSQAYINALFPSTPTVTSFSTSLYALPYASADVLPKVLPFTMSGTLRSDTNVALGAGLVTLSAGPIGSYCGKAFINQRSQTGGGFNPAGRLNEYTVAGGSATPVRVVWFPPFGGANTVTWQEFLCDPLFKVLEFVNPTGAAAGTFDYTISAEDYI